MVIDMSTPIDFAVYAVANADGQYFRAKGYGGEGATWVDDIVKAKIYPRIGQARSRITYFANHFPSYPVPHLVKLKITELEILDEDERVEKAKLKKIKEKEMKEIRRKQWAVDQAKRDLANAQQRLNQAKGWKGLSGFAGDA